METLLSPLLQQEVFTSSKRFALKSAESRSLHMTEAHALLDRTAAPAVSLVVPVRDEADNIPPLIDEIAATMVGRFSFEVIFVDDGSRDSTEATLRRLMEQFAWLRQMKHSTPCGKSAALHTGITVARAPIVVSLDGDGQNDPSFIPALVHALEVGGPRIGLIAGERVKRQASGFRRFQSCVANVVFAVMLRDRTRDTGCGLKAFRREIFLSLPFFDGLHRFLPALVRREGYEIGYIEVIDRPRRHGSSNYGMWDRLRDVIPDLFGVWWLLHRRARIPLISEVRCASGTATSDRKQTTDDRSHELRARGGIVARARADV
jgi:glycosyltransferase involved in cell wall biosynthesis